MAGYVKVWVSHWTEDWFVEMTCLERGVWLQLLIIAKQDGDTGRIFLRNFPQASSKLGLDGKTLRKILGKFQNRKIIELEIRDTGLIHIYIPKYIEYQELNNPKTIVGKNREKSRNHGILPENSRLPDQTIVPDHTIPPEKSDDGDLELSKNQKFEKAWDELCECKLLHTYQDKLDVDSEGRKMKNWVAVNTAKKNYRKFIINWLNRAVEGRDKNARSQAVRT